MSRTALLALLLTAGPARAETAAMETYLDLTSAEPRCKAATGGEILVCGRREADRYRVPLITPVRPGDPKTTNVPEERARLTAQESACARQAALPYGCGMVGVRMSTKLAGDAKIELRPLAP